MKLFSQDALRDQYSCALKLYNSGQYYDAITELKRLLFFDNKKNYTYDANEIIGMSYKMGAKFSDAILYFTIAEMNAGNAGQLFTSKIEVVRSNILRRTTSHAIALLDSLKKDGRFTAKTEDINYWTGWAYIFEDRWDEASRLFSDIDSAKSLAEFCKDVDQEKYSVTFADIISHFIPGAGQIYTGHYVSGFLSLGWNVLWGYLTINAFVENRVFDGLVIGNLLWLRFYSGNLQNAVKYAKDENTGITNKALDYLQSGYQGLKP
jgi:TM2 domain-containing membrane protein YozV